MKDMEGPQTNSSRGMRTKVRGRKEKASTVFTFLHNTGISYALASRLLEHSGPVEVGQGTSRSNAEEKSLY